MSAEDPKSKEALIGLGRLLAQLRTNAGYSQWEFALLTGYSRSSLSDAELGRHLMRREFWIATDTALHMNGQLVEAWDRITEMRTREREERLREKQRNRQHGTLLIDPGVRLMSMTLVWSNGTATVLNPREKEP